jgi:tetratricopeptide (TPR) repeat protein
MVKSLLFRRTLATLLLVLLPLPSFALPRERDSWLRVESPHYVFFSNATERSSRRIAINLERLRDVLVQLDPGMKVDSGRPLNIYVFEDNIALVPYKPLRDGKPANIAGFFLGSQDATYMVMQAEMGTDIERLLYHEFLHSVMGAGGDRRPLWLNEGMAEFYSTFHATDQHAEIGRPIEDHIRTLREGNMIPLSRLFAVTYDSKDYNEGYRQGIFYAESWALVHYLLMSNPARRAQTFQFFESVSHGAPALETFRSTFQTTEEQIEKELRDYVHRSLFNYVQIPVKPAAELTIRTEPLPRYETLTRLGDLLLYQRDAARFPEAEQHYRAALEKKPGYGPAQAGLCQIQLEAGHAAEALTCFEKAAKAAPDDAVLQSRYARLLREKGPQDASTALKGREALTRVAAQRPDDGRAWVELAMTYVNENPMPPEAIPIFEKAWRLRPEDSWAIRGLIIGYVRSGQEGRAAGMIESDFTPSLRPVAWNTWTDEMSQQANRLLIEQKGEEALAILEEITRRAPADQAGKVAGQLAEIRPVVEHNRFIRRYNEAVALLQAQKVKEAHVILQELVAKAPSPEDAEKTRKLAVEVEEFLKKQPKKKS